MNILILGAGQVGSNVAYQLAREEANQVTIVDIDPAAVRDLQDRLDVRIVIGHCAYPEVLERAGAHKADLIIALTHQGLDEDKALAKAELGIDLIIGGGKD